MKNKLKKYFIIFMVSVILMTMNGVSASSIDDSSSFTDVKQKVLDEYLNATAWRSDDILDETSIIVKFQPDTLQPDRILFEDEFGLQSKEQLTEDANLFSYTLPEDLEVSLKLLTKINNSSAILYAEPNYKCSVESEPYYNLLWNLKNQVYTGVDINVENAWKLTKGNSSVVVAVIDSGIDYNHPDLRDNIWVNTKEIANNGIDDDKNGYVDDSMGWNFYGKNNRPMDEYSHGTHVAGIIAASENNYGVVGVAPKVKLMSLKIFGADGGMSNFSDVISAIVYAYNNGASMVNMSFGGRGYSQSLCDIMSKYKNMLFISAAGNNGTNNDTIPFYPGSYEMVNNISVASMDQNGALSSYSNYGVKGVDVAAPGKNIYSTIPNSRFGYKSGTSMATPHVTGIAALMKSYNGNVSASEIKQAIMNTVKPIQSLQGKIKTGGLVDAEKALASISPPVKVDKISDIFPDTVLANEIARQLGKSVNSAFTDVDGKKIVSIVIEGGVKNAKGIEKLPNLTKLRLANGSLTSIDVSKNVKLTALELSYNKITSINLSNNVNIQRLLLFSNSLTSLDLTKNKSLSVTNLGNNQLTSLNLSQNVKLDQLFAENNKISTVNFGNVNTLRVVYLGSNSLRTLDLSKQKSLLYYKVDNNPLIQNGLKLPSK